MPGKFYVDSQCTDCDSCRVTAPGIFGHDKSTGTSCVVRQPGTPEEVAAAMEALRACGSDAIGCDGEEHAGAENAAPVPEALEPAKPASPTSRVAVGLVVAAAIALLAYILYRMAS